MDMGRYEQMDFADILNDPRYDPNMEKEGIHARCDKIYGLWVTINLSSIKA